MSRSAIARNTCRSLLRACDEDIQRSPSWPSKIRTPKSGVFVIIKICSLVLNQKYGSLTVRGAWFFVTLPKEITESIKLVAAGLSTRGFGSIKVVAKTNSTHWNTSIFPDNKTKSYLLPIKREVRDKASIKVGDVCRFKIQIIDFKNR